MATEQQRAERSKARGEQAARMLKSGQPLAKVRQYISAQGDQEAEARRINSTIGKAAGFSSDPMSFESGGIIPKTGIYKLHAGERVIPASTGGNSMGHGKHTGQA